MSLQEKIANWLKKYLIQNKLDSFVIGISGGIDSAVSSTLCAMTGIKTYVLVMPIHQNPIETDLGNKHYNWLKSKYNNVEKIEIELTDTYEKMKSQIPKQFHNNLSLANTRARIRMTTLYAISGGVNGIVVGTGNKIEDFGVGFFTKYGDGGVDISPIADLMKSEVYTLGKNLGIDNEIIEAAPTDGLWNDGRTDEKQLGVTYDELEWAMNFRSNNLHDNNLNTKELRILKIYDKHRKNNLHKMRGIPIFKSK